jgi:hypothetical protein
MSRIPVGHGLRDFPRDRVSLRQRERNRTDSHKQEQIRRASNEVRFDSRINLFFHVGSLVKRSLSLFWLWTPYLLQKTIEKCQYKFRDCSPEIHATPNYDGTFLGWLGRARGLYARTSAA